MNKLQFQRTTQLFATRDEALTYIQLNRASIPAEPIVAMYGAATEPSVILGIGSAIGKYFIIDITKIESDINDLKTIIETNTEDIVLIQTDINNLTDLVNEVIKGGGLTSEGKYDRLKVATDTILANALDLTGADLMLSAAITQLRSDVENGSVLTIPKLSGRDGNIIYADTAQGNGGLFASVILEFDSDTGILTLKGEKEGQFEYSVNLGLNNIGIESAEYDAGNKAIVIVFKKTDGTTQTLNIPVGDLVDEWEILNNPDSAVLLKKTYDSVTNIYTLTADIKIGDSATHPQNILKKDGNGLLYVSGNSDNLYYHGTTKTVTDKFDEISTNIITTLDNAKSYTDTEVTKEASLRQNADASTLITASQDATDKDNVLKGELQQQIINTNATTESTLTTLFNSKLSDETSARISKDTELQAQISGISARTVKVISTGTNTPISTIREVDVDGNTIIDLAFNVSGVFGNLLIKDSDGLLAKATVDYNTSDGTFNLLDANGNIVSNTKIPVAGVIDSVDYIEPNLIIKFKLTDGTIDEQIINLSEIINAWEVDNKTDSAITLTKVNAGTIDKLSADIKIQGYSGTNNILHKAVTGELYVTGTAGNISYNATNVGAKLDDLTATIGNLPTSDTHITSGQVFTNGSVMRLSYGTDDVPNTGYIDIPTSVFMDNTDTYVTSVTLNGNKIMLGFNDLSKPSLDCDLSTLSGKGISIIEMVSDNAHIHVETIDGTSFIIDLDEIQGLLNYYTKSEVDALIPTDYVKAVNGTLPDLNGNVIIDIAEAVSDVTMDTASNSLVVHYTTTKPSTVISLPKESFLANVSYDPSTHIITFTMVDGSTFQINISDMIKEYIASSTGGLEVVDTNQFGIKASGVIETMLANAIVEKLNKVLSVAGSGSAIESGRYVAAITVNDHVITALKADLPTISTTLNPAAGQDISVGGDMSAVTALLNDASVVESKVGTGAITNTKIHDGAITTSKIQDNQVTKVKLSTDVQGRLDKKVTVTGGGSQTGYYVSGFSVSDGDHEITVQKELLPSVTVVQTTGTSTTDVMSQKAVTDTLDNLGFGFGDMLKRDYDSDGDGKVNKAVIADSATTANSVPFSGITSKPATLSGYGITDATPSSHVGSTGTNQHGLGNGTVAGFSTNDYTTTDKNKLSSLPTTVGDMRTSIYDTNGDGRVNGADNANTLQTPRNFSITGDVTANAVSFDGSANVALSGVLSNSGITAGTYTKLTVDSKGRATAGTNATVDDITGTINLTVLEI